MDKHIIVFTWVYKVTTWIKNRVLGKSTSTTQHQILKFLYIQAIYDRIKVAVCLDLFLILQMQMRKY